MIKFGYLWNRNKLASNTYYMEKQLRIIAIRPLGNCVPHILRVLKPNITYFLYNNYEMCDNDQFIRNKGEVIPFDFFRLDSNSPNIGISAIVGKNGDGKSSLVELMIRVLNNFAKKYNFGGDSQNLTYIEEIQAELYFSYISEKNDEIIYKIRIENRNIELYKNSYKNQIWNINNEKKSEELSFFYTLVSNYSIYAYNTNDFQRENIKDECWLDSVFHKNDGYQTPIVLHPFRQKGNIDINTESNLTKQRLISLFVTDDKSSNSFRNINGKFALSLEWNLSTKSKLDSSIFEYFREVKRNLPFTTERTKKIESDDNNNLRLFIEFISQNQSFFSKYNNEKKVENISPLLKNNDASDFHNLFEEMQSGSCPDSINELNFDQFMRLVIVIFYRKEWETVLQHIHQEKSIIVNDKIKNRLLDYLAYKSISITEKYTKYKTYAIKCSFSDFFNNVSRLGDEELCKLKGSLISMLEDRSHITLKIRQCANFMYINELAKDRLDNNTTDFTEVYNKYKETIKSFGESVEAIDLLPPPIYDTDVVLISKPNNVESKLSDLSSGEKQLIYSVSSILYHLRNINSVEQTPVINKYRHINLIFEEIELYFHPEFQRQYIKYLLENISKINLSSIESINICFVTHSPFVLSDIPISNVLFLEEGESREFEDVNTFASNIHSLLTNQFFLRNGVIGAFAQQLIKETVVSLLEADLKKDNEERVSMIIDLIGEPVLRAKLLDMFKERGK